MNHYYMTNGDTCDSSKKWQDQNWGAAWLSKFVTYAVLVRGHELWDQLSGLQKEQLGEIVSNEVKEDTFYLDDNCGTWKGNSCSEDFVSFLMTLSAAKNFFPQYLNVPETSVMEEQYFDYTFSTTLGFYSLVMETMPWDTYDDGNLSGMPDYIKMYNHGGESPVYAAIILTGLGNALYPYRLTGNVVPHFYYFPSDTTTSAKFLFLWVQHKTAPTGIAFLDACHTVDGDTIPCSDPGIADATPLMFPAGRPLSFLFGIVFTQSHIEDYYDFESYNGVKTNNKELGVGRTHFYDVWNPSSIDAN